MLLKPVHCMLILGLHWHNYYEYQRSFKGYTMRKQELHPRTAQINKKQKNFSKKARHDALLWLTQKFPLVFDNSQMIQPLKLGIMEDIMVYAEEAAAAGISKSKLREAVVLFTRRIDYLACLKAREMRVDLNGMPTQAVTEDEATRAALKIRKRVEKTAKNARKIAPLKIQTPSSSNFYDQGHFKSDIDEEAYDLDQGTPYLSQAHFHASTQAPPVVIKHKISRSFDPDAVARLKEKLGLTRKNRIQETLE